MIVNSSVQKYCGVGDTQSLNGVQDSSSPPHVFQASWFKPPKPQKWKSCSLDGRITRPPADYTTSLLREKTEERDPGEQKEEEKKVIPKKESRGLKLNS